MIDWIDRLIEKYSLHYLIQERNLVYLLLLLTFLLGVYLNWTDESIILLMFLVWHIIYPVKSSVLIKMLLFILAIVPVLLFIQRPVMAETFSVCAFFLFILIPI